ncbi:MAG: peptidylprolyl isomerase [Alphaproteobacteria bacterium]|nr:peptidylprolyl isomerase [Alphaproteobacteria bacterium]
MDMSRVLQGARAPALIGTAVAIALIAPAFGQSTTPAADRVAASVNGVQIRHSEVVAMIETLPAQYQQMPIEVLYPALLDRLIDGKLLGAAGRAKNLHNEAEVKRKLVAYEDRLIQEAFLTAEIRSQVTEDALKKRYDESIKNHPTKEEVRARHILVDTEDKAKAVIAELKKGADFANVAKARSTDPAAAQGGDLGFFSAEQMVPEFSEAAFKLKNGEISQTPVKTNFGWHVIKVEERRTQAPPTFEDTKDDLSQEMSREVITGVIAGLRDKAKVERFNMDGTPMKAN